MMNKELVIVIIRCSRLKYVPINTRDGFFIFDFEYFLNFSLREAFQKEIKKFVLDHFKEGAIAVFYKGTLMFGNREIFRGDIEKKVLESLVSVKRWEKILIDLFIKNQKAIEEAPVFTLHPYFKREFIKINENTIAQKFVLNTNQIKISDSKHFSRVIDLLREAGLFYETRGKNKKKDATQEKLINFLRKRCTQLKRQNKKSIIKILANDLKNEVVRLFGDDVKRADKYTMSELAIRRHVGDLLKKAPLIQQPMAHYSLKGDLIPLQEWNIIKK